jgi:hypothetical protein
MLFVFSNLNLLVLFAIVVSRASSSASLLKKHLNLNLNHHQDHDHDQIESNSNSNGISNSDNDNVFASHYATNFSTFDSAHWTLDDSNCAHCSHDNGIECTQERPSAVSFASVVNGTGATITTTLLDKKSSCGAIEQSGHLEFKSSTLYGTYNIVSQWYPKSPDEHPEGYIGWIGSGGAASMFFGFGNNAHQIKTNTYADKSKDGDDEKYVQTPDTNLATALNLFTFVWSKDKIEWKLNGKVVRTETNTKYIPTVPMTQRLHSRSGDATKMKQGDSFKAMFTFYEYIPPN